MKEKNKMARKNKDVDSKIGVLEAAKEKYLSENTVISIGGYNFTPAKLMLAGTILSTILGGLYGVFTVYNDYMSMKEAIQTYVTPDLSGINERISKVEERIVASEKITNETGTYVRDIRTGLQTDIRSLSSVVDANERRGRELDREVRSTVNALESANTQIMREVNSRLLAVDRENDAALKALEKKVDDKIQKAWENPLAK